MRIDRILHCQLGNNLEGIHAARVRAVFDGAGAALRGGQISLTGIGRAIAVGTTHKHGIKRVDRLLGNDAVWREREIYFRALAHRLIPPRSRPIIIVDWTGFTTKLWSLVAAVAFEGRAIVIYAETHPISQYNLPHLNKQFLLRLKGILPDQCVPIVTTDAGFRSPWMREVTGLGWDYICRLRGLNRVRKAGNKRWSRLSGFAAQIGKGVKDFGQCEAGLRALHESRIVGFARSRDCRWKNKWRGAAKNDRTKAIRSAKEPWLLSTSLRCAAKKVIALYRKRMQIEETFRDAKSPRFGLSMEFARTRLTRRVDVLMLLAALALILSLVIGLAGQSSQLERYYQANTTRSKRVLSTCRLGRLIADDLHTWGLNHAWIKAGWVLLTKQVASSWTARI